jgi:hypothetical protein
MAEYYKSPVPIKRANTHLGGRPKGVKNKKSQILVDETPLDIILRSKRETLNLFDRREVDNISQAAEKLGVSKLRMHAWRRADPEWAKQLEVAEELIADELEVELRACKNPAQVTALIFRLKGIRPQKYRDNFKFEVENPRVQEILAEIKRLGAATASLPTLTARLEDGSKVPAVEFTIDASMPNTAKFI